MAAPLTQYLGSIDDSYNYGTTVAEIQSFQVLQPCIISGVSFYGTKGNLSSGSTFTVNIRDSTYNGTILKTQTFNTSILPAFVDPPVAFVNLDFTTGFIITDPTKTYFLEIVCNNGSATDEIRWSLDNTSPAYAGGTKWNSLGVQDTAKDHNFSINGIYLPTVGFFALSGHER